jgi:hypothetical protein
MKNFLLLTTLLCAAANAGAEETPRNSGGRGAAPPVDGPTPSAGPISLDSPDLPVGKAILLIFPGNKEVKGFKDPIYGFMDHNGVAFPATSQPTHWKPLPE